MKGKILYILSVVAVLALSGCGTMTKSRHFAPGQVQLNVMMADLEYLGQADIEVTYRTYLGFIRVVDTVNGMPYDRTNVEEVTLYAQIGSTLLSRPMSKAASLVLALYPDATYFQPVSQTKVTQRLFLGTQTKVMAEIKAYKIKQTAQQ